MKTATQINCIKNCFYIQSNQIYHQLFSKQTSQKTTTSPSQTLTFTVPHCSEINSTYISNSIWIDVDRLGQMFTVKISVKPGNEGPGKILNLKNQTHDAVNVENVQIVLYFKISNQTQVNERYWSCDCALDHLRSCWRWWSAGLDAHNKHWDSHSSAVHLLCCALDSCCLRFVFLRSQPVQMNTVILTLYLLHVW